MPCLIFSQEPDQQPPAAATRNYLSDNKKLTPLDSLVDGILTKFIQNPGNCGISIGISKNGANYFYNYGASKRNSSEMTNRRTIYEIGALTSTFCGLLLANAVIEKKINLDDDVRKYLPGKYPHLIFGKTNISIKHLANHSSGLRSVPEDLRSSPGFDSLNPYKNYTREMLYRYLQTARPDTEPGKVCNYSNIGMALLGLVLEKVYNQTFETLVQEKICLPNQMSSTGINLSLEQAKRFADGHSTDGSATPHWDFDGFTAAGAIKSDAEDLIRYLNYNQAEKDETTKLSHQLTFSGHEKLALAWFIKNKEPGNTLLWQNGATFGFGCFAGFLKEKNCSLVILANSLTSVDYIAIALLKYLQQ